MEIIEKFLSPAGKNKLAACTKKHKSAPLYVVGIHVNETELVCSKPEPVNGLRIPGQPSGDPYCKKVACRKKVAWNGTADFIVPPSCFDFLCTQDNTYGDVISSFLKESVLELVKPVSGAVIAAFSFPVHSLWENSKEELQQLVDRCFSDCEWLIPTVVPLFDHGAREKQDTIVYVDGKWTTFLLEKKKYSVSFGTNTNFRSFRCNDYLNNSTREWVQEEYPSWEAGFADICCALSKLRKGPKQPLTGIADEAHRDVIRRIVARIGLATDDVVWENPADITLKVVFPGTLEARQQNRKPTPNRGKQERQVKTTEDLFKF